MKRIFVIVIALCLLLCACTSQPEATEPPTQAPTDPAPTAPPTEPTEPPTEPATEPTEPPVFYRNPLNGEPIDAPWTKRPFASTVNNISYAMPHHGTSQADFLYECLVEGGMTRCLAVFSDIEQVEKLGSVRSARVCLVDIARSYDAIFSHAGANTYAYTEFREVDCDDIDALSGLGASYYYRDQDRLDAGYAIEHTLFTSGKDMIDFATEKGYSLTKSEPIDYGYVFADDATPESGERAREILISFQEGGKTTKMTYNAQTKSYEGYEHDEDYIDGNTNKIVPFKNVFVLHSDTTYSEGLTFMELTGEGEGYFACGGKIVPIIWHRANYYDPFSYTLTDGTPLTLGVGHSYVAVIPYRGIVEYQ